MSVIKDDFFYIDPPETESFQELFLYFWNHGVGLKQNNGVPIPWNPQKLEAAFEKINRTIEVRTIENWRAGKSIPRRKNLLALATIAAAGDSRRRKLWAESFVQHYENKSEAIPQKKEISTEEASLEIEKNRLPWAGLASLITVAFASLFFIFRPSPLKSSVAGPPTQIKVDGFKNNTDNPDFDLLINGFESQIIDTLYQLDDVRINTDQTSDPAYKVGCDLAGLKTAYKLYCRIIGGSGDVLWSKQRPFESPADFIDIQAVIPNAIAGVTNIVISDEAKSRMRLLGTESLDGYLAYLKGRKSLKSWHENRSDLLMQEAYNKLSLAIDSDPSWAEPKFHIVDIYHHFVVEDVRSLGGLSVQKARQNISPLLEEVSRSAKSEFEKSKASMNAKFFSEDWTLLNSFSDAYVTSATSLRGELEWLFEPVILLVTGETDLLRTLVEGRILKFDPENGTGQAYLIRSYLLEGRYKKARNIYEASNTRYFSNRVEQVGGYLLFAERNYAALKAHSEQAENLTQDYRDYFKLLSLIGGGERLEAENILETSSDLKSNRVHYALANFHLGHQSQGLAIIEQISARSLGDLDIATEIAYGAVCQIDNFTLPKSLLEKYNQANIRLPGCVIAEAKPVLE